LDKALLSANFKKDYIAYSAVAIFFLIIAFEIFMAIFIPAHLHMEGVWDDEVARQEMIRTFDYTRRTFLRFKSNLDNTEDEAKIIADSLTPLADYLREYQYKIELEQINEIDKDINGLNKFYYHLSKKGAYSVDRKMETEKYLNVLKAEMKKEN
jgi:hypothetical protein